MGSRYYCRQKLPHELCRNQKIAAPAFDTAVRRPSRSRRDASVAAFSATYPHEANRSGSVKRIARICGTSDGLAGRKRAEMYGKPGISPREVVKWRAGRGIGNAGRFAAAA